MQRSVRVSGTHCRSAAMAAIESGGLHDVLEHPAADVERPWR